MIIPAHNEGGSIGQTLASLREQTVPPVEIIVACDNCTDDTEQVARTAGTPTFLTYRNTAKKAGALNQVRNRLCAGALGRLCQGPGPCLHSPGDA